MTKKDFIAIASVLDANVADLSLVLDFADMCEADNPRFDRAAFISASTANLLVGHDRQKRIIEIAKRPRKA